MKEIKDKLAQVFHFDLYGKRDEKYTFLIIREAFASSEGFPIEGFPNNPQLLIFNHE